MDSTLFNVLLSLITLIGAIGGSYLVNFLRQKIGNDKLNSYYNMAKQVVMAIEQANPQLAGLDKKELAINKLIELTGNKITHQQADTLIEAAVYDIKKLLSSVK
ncbi:MAG: phage holin, LLH family [Romboutsia sp.]|uniref:phage holin, LLH family n=1 Tax=Romboutsia sp. TaxID=1965302 RepID=UPI003F3AABDE